MLYDKVILYGKKLYCTTRKLYCTVLLSVSTRGRMCMLWPSSGRDNSVGLLHNVFVSGVVKMTKIVKIPKIMATISLRYPESILIQELKNHTPRL